MSLREIVPGFWAWRWMSPEKGYFFNGTLAVHAGKKVLIDPVLLESGAMAKLESMGPFDAIYLSNKDHERMAYDLRRKWNLPLGIHEFDVEFLKEKPDFTFKDGQELFCDLKVVHLREQKSPGECAFYSEGKKTLIVGDALIGHPAGKLNMLPDMKYADPRKAQAGLRRLFSLQFETLLVGDGEPVLEKAYEKMGAFFESIR